MSEWATAPKFDPSQPFEVDGAAGPAPPMVPGAAQPPAFDPSQPFMVEHAPRSTAQELGRQVMFAPRWLAEGAAALPLMVGDATNAGINLGTGVINRVAGTNIPALPPASKSFQAGLNAVGLPQPENASERITGDISKAVASVPTYAATAAATGAKALAPLTQKLGQQVTAAAGSALGSSGAREAGAPLWAQILAGLTGGVLGGLRTSDNPEVAQRIAEFKKAGVNPSVGDAKQSSFWQWVQKVVGVVPTADTVVSENEAARVGQAQRAAGDIASGYGAAQSQVASGEAAQNAVENYRFGERPSGMTDHEVLTQPTRASSVSTKADVLYSRIPIAPQATIDVTKTAEALNSAVNAYDNPELAKAMADPKLKQWSDILASSGNKLSWSDLQRLRTDVRYLQSKASLTPNLDDRALNSVYGALTDDLYNGAATVGGDRAAQMVKRANDYYSLAMQGVKDKLQNIFNTNRPEGVYSQIQSAISANPNKADIGKLAELQRVMPKDEWGNLAATVIDGLGRPTPGTAIAPDAPQFSVGQFVTRYNQMSPQAKELLFNGAGQGELKSSLDNLSKVLAYMKTADKFANTSNSANLGGKMAFIGSIPTAVGAAFLGHPGPMIGIGSALAGANISARAMYNPTFVKLMAQSLSASPAGQAQTVAQIARFAVENPALADDARGLIMNMGTRAVPAQPDSNQ